MELRLDLHIHSERSFDGCMSLSEIVALARERGLNGVAICDHDRVLDEVPEFDDFLVIPATEVFDRARASAGSLCERTHRNEEVFRVGHGHSRTGRAGGHRASL